MFGSDCDEGDEKIQLSVIKDLMEQLIGEMSPSAEDFEERLGRKKPEIEVMKVEAGPVKKSEEMAMDMGEDMEEMSPEDKLKERLMKLRA